MGKSLMGGKKVYVKEASDVEAGGEEGKASSEEPPPGLAHVVPTLAQTARGVKVAAAMRRTTRRTESARTLLTHEPHELLGFYDRWSLARTARRSPLWKNALLRVLPYIWPSLLGISLVYRLGPTAAMSTIMFTGSLMLITAGGQLTWVKCRQLSYIVDVTDGHCLSDADACYKWVKRSSLFCKVVILAMIYVATPLEVLYVVWSMGHLIGWWTAAVPIGILYAASHISGATTILGSLAIVFNTSIVGCYAYQWWAETAVCVLGNHKEFSGGNASAEERALEFAELDVNHDGTIGVEEYVALQVDAASRRERGSRVVQYAQTSVRARRAGRKRIPSGRPSPRRRRARGASTNTSTSSSAPASPASSSEEAP